MLNPHPPLTGFPVVMLSLVVTAEAFGLYWKKHEARRFACTLLIILAFIAPLTYFSGYWGSDFASLQFDVPQEQIIHHQSLAKLFLVTFAACLIFSLLRFSAQHGKKYFTAVYTVLLLISYGLALYTSWLGGELVFRYGAGVESREVK